MIENQYAYGDLIVFFSNQKLLPTVTANKLCEEYSDAKNVASRQKVFMYHRLGHDFFF